MSSQTPGGRYRNSPASLGHREQDVKHPSDLNWSCHPSNAVMTRVRLPVYDMVLTPLHSSPFLLYFADPKTGHMVSHSLPYNMWFLPVCHVPFPSATRQSQAPPTSLNRERSLSSLSQLLLKTLYLLLLVISVLHWNRLLQRPHSLVIEVTRGPYPIHFYIFII